jgi:hypothetical protein
MPVITVFTELQSLAIAICNKTVRLKNCKESFLKEIKSGIEV